MTWDEPLEEKCPKCGTSLFKKRGKMGRSTAATTPATMSGAEGLMTVSVIGAGLAGCEAAWQLARRGFDVRLYEMKPKKFSPAHHYPGMAELVCSNSLKAMRLSSAAGLLKEEMERVGFPHRPLC